MEITFNREMKFVNEGLPKNLLFKHIFAPHKSHKFGFFFFEDIYKIYLSPSLSLSFFPLALSLFVMY